MPATRLAPSPTGALHLGNARTFLINWLLARQQNWKIILRIEDLDGPRVKKDADQAAIDDLQWLGLNWDDGPIYQSSRAPLYQAAINKLIHDEKAYPCVCTRREAEAAASAPHADDMGTGIYPGTCRDRFTSVADALQKTGRYPAIRFRVPDRVVEFNDGFAGPMKVNLSNLGDFVIAKADKTAAYHLAVVVDDADMEITHIVRGDDLLDSTARHLLLYESLGLSARIPTWFHLPLVIGADGRRLAKRHGDTRLAHYRRQGVPAARILGLLARWCGMNCGEETTLDYMLANFQWNRVPRQPIVFTAEDESWLVSQPKLS
ncbi:MAG: tRNA glutamyl-Q(34) synthetase GluQRS [Tepidisphaeraceae bacterium]|jgi:glutamyl-tRNA synthetase